MVCPHKPHHLIQSSVEENNQVETAFQRVRIGWGYEAGKLSESQTQEKDNFQLCGHQPLECFYPIMVPARKNKQKTATRVDRIVNGSCAILKQIEPTRATFSFAHEFARKTQKVSAIWTM